MRDEPVALIVNAGGQSLRMGRTKALLSMPGNGTPLIAHIIDRLLPQASAQVIVVTNDPAVVEAVSEPGNIRCATDLWPDSGALGGLASGLAVVSGWAMVVACDMPFVDPALFTKLLEVARAGTSWDAIIPRVAGQAQPFHGLWHHRSLAALNQRLATGKLRVQDALGALNVAWMDEAALGIDTDSLAFYNVNTPKEWEVARQILVKQEGPLAK